MNRMTGSLWYWWDERLEKSAPPGPRAWREGRPGGGDAVIVCGAARLPERWRDGPGGEPLVLNGGAADYAAAGWDEARRRLAEAALDAAADETVEAGGREWQSGSYEVSLFELRPIGVARRSGFASGGGVRLPGGGQVRPLEPGNFRYRQLVRKATAALYALGLDSGIVALRAADNGRLSVEDVRLPDAKTLSADAWKKAAAKLARELVAAGGDGGGAGGSGGVVGGNGGAMVGNGVATGGNGGAIGGNGVAGGGSGGVVGGNGGAMVGNGGGPGGNGVATGGNGGAIGGNGIAAAGSSGAASGRGGMPPGILIGADPEFLLIGSKGKVVPAIRYLEGGHGAGCDAVVAGGRVVYPVAELRPAPAATPGELAANIRRLLALAAERIGDAPLRWAAGGMPAPGFALGGHIHLSGVRLTARLLRQLDSYVALPLAMVETAAERARRPRFGRLGDFRLQPHGGFEYRTPPSWLASPAAAKAVFALSLLCAAETERLAYRPAEDAVVATAFYNGDREKLRSRCLPRLAESLAKTPSYRRLAEYIEPLLNAAARGDEWDVASDLRSKWRVGPWR